MNEYRKGSCLMSISRSCPPGNSKPAVFPRNSSQRWTGIGRPITLSLPAVLNRGTMRYPDMESLFAAMDTSMAPPSPPPSAKW